MGTSSSYGGPKGKNPLLPKDFDEDSPDNSQHNQQSEEKEQTVNTLLWQNAKTQISKLIKDSNRNTKSALASYTKALGGSRKAASTAISGKTTTIKLGNFLSSISSQGIQNTLNQYNIEFKDRSVEEVLGDIVNEISPIPETKEDSIARNALLDALEILYEEINENDKSIDILDNLDEQTFINVMKTYISSYIFQRFLNDFESRFEAYSENSNSALELENDIKEYIVGVVNNKVKDDKLKTLNYSSNSIVETINEIYTDCYEVIEGAF